MKEIRYWTTREGKKLKISEMETSHIKNCMSMIERKCETEGILIWGYVGFGSDIDGDIADSPEELDSYNWFKEELSKRIEYLRLISSSNKLLNKENEREG